MCALLIFFPGGAGGLGKPVPLRRSGIQVPTNQVLWLLLTLAKEEIQLALAVFEKSCSKVLKLGACWNLLERP